MSTSPRRIGKYEMQSVLGRGGMAEVWKAVDTQLGRTVAIKFLHADLQNDPNFLTRFEREARVIAALNHPNILKIYDFPISRPPESPTTTCYMVMDYIPGQTLAAYIRQTSRMGKFPSMHDILHLFFGIGMAVDYAHQRGVIHRDIKPGNILLDTRGGKSSSPALHTIGEPILADFGIVKLLGATSNTVSGGWFGTPLYVSPEQVKGMTGNEQSDGYAIAVILYEIMTGRAPIGANLGTQELLTIPQIWRRILDINEPLLQTWYSFKLGFHNLHRLFGQFDPTLIRRCD